MLLLEGKQLSKNLLQKEKHSVYKMIRKPGLGIIIVGERYDSKLYVRKKQEACQMVGIHTYDVCLNESVDEATILLEIEKMNSVSGLNGFG